MAGLMTNPPRLTRAIRGVTHSPALRATAPREILRGNLRSGERTPDPKRYDLPWLLDPCDAEHRFHGDAVPRLFKAIELLDLAICDSLQPGRAVARDPLDSRGQCNRPGAGRAAKLLCRRDGSENPRFAINSWRLLAPSGMPPFAAFLALELGGQRYVSP